MRFLYKLESRQSAARFEFGVPGGTGWGRSGPRERMLTPRDLHALVTTREKTISDAL